MYLLFPSKKSGFSLVELVVVILLVGILSVIVGPKLFLRSSVDAYALRDEFIANMRQVQIMAMNNIDRKYLMNITDKGYQGAYYDSDDAIIPTGEFNLYPNKTSLTLIGNTNLLQNNHVKQFHLNFDPQGRVKQCLVPNCIQVNGGDILNILVESQGYIHAKAIK